MAFLSGNENNDKSEDDDEDITQQPTEPMMLEQMLQVITDHRTIIRERFERSGIKRECPLCCMKLEEETGAFLTTDGALLLLCEYHCGRIEEACEEELEVWAPLIHVAWLRYAWPPGY